MDIEDVVVTGALDVVVTDAFNVLVTGALDVLVIFNLNKCYDIPGA